MEVVCTTKKYSSPSTLSSLSSSLRIRLRIWGVLLLVISPFAFLLLMLYSFFRYGEVRYLFLPRHVYIYHNLIQHTFESSTYTILTSKSHCFHKRVHMCIHVHTIFTCTHTVDICDTSIIDIRDTSRSISTPFTPHLHHLHAFDFLMFI